MKVSPEFISETRADARPSGCWKWRQFAQSALNATASNSRSNFPKPTCNARRFRLHSRRRRNSRESLRDRVRILRFRELNRVVRDADYPRIQRLFDALILAPPEDVAVKVRRSDTLIRICINARRDRKVGDRIYKRGCADVRAGCKEFNYEM